MYNYHILKNTLSYQASLVQSQDQMSDFINEPNTCNHEWEFSLHEKRLIMFYIIFILQALEKLETTGIEKAEE